MRHALHWPALEQIIRDYAAPREAKEQFGEDLGVIIDTPKQDCLIMEWHAPYEQLVYCAHRRGRYLSRVIEMRYEVNTPFWCGVLLEQVQKRLVIIYALGKDHRDAGADAYVPEVRNRRKRPDIVFDYMGFQRQRIAPRDKDIGNFRMPHDIVPGLVYVVQYLFFG